MRLSRDLAPTLSQYPAYDSARLAYIEALLRDTAVVNSTRWALFRALKDTGLVLETGMGGYRRTLEVVYPTRRCGCSGDDYWDHSASSGCVVLTRTGGSPGQRCHHEDAPQAHIPVQITLPLHYSHPGPRSPVAGKKSSHRRRKCGTQCARSMLQRPRWYRAHTPHTARSSS